MFKTLLASALAGGLFIAPAAAQSIGGSYSVAGTNLDGSTYSGEAEITLLSDTTCSIEWKTGETTSDGICSRNDNAFAAAYVLQDDFGLVVYKVMPDGSLHGLWTIAGKDGNGTEVLTPQ
ncbi:hypothetical protein KEU06_00665 [Pseudaminobacter sp. 19-2017]|uniref:Uncharacterized protein n=1 Tax=Pseudaminobacter soli (ex Zhang et al. 2022) TaxID=2831468 RepID=A0A942DVL2_9HYPH|nr:hypothetical protein [Pseudaminobacter soli]MBS3647137.1 hypothetical protein [Pseudaminobacter soli]